MKRTLRIRKDANKKPDMKVYLKTSRQEGGIFVFFYNKDGSGLALLRKPTTPVERRFRPGEHTVSAPYNAPGWLLLPDDLEPRPLPKEIEEAVIYLEIAFNRAIVELLEKPQPWLARVLISLLKDRFYIAWEEPHPWLTIGLPGSEELAPLSPESTEELKAEAEILKKEVARRLRKRKGETH